MTSARLPPDVRFTIRWRRSEQEIVWLQILKAALLKAIEQSTICYILVEEQRQDCEKHAANKSQKSK